MSLRTSRLKNPLHSINGENSVVRAKLDGVFPTYKRLKDGTRRTYWYHRATGKRLRGEPGSSEFITDLPRQRRRSLTGSQVP